MHEFENLVYELRLKGVEVNETLLVTSLIKKLPSSWNKFERMLKQKYKEFSFIDLLISIRIEEGHRNAQKMCPNLGFCARPNMIEISISPSPIILRKNPIKLVIITTK